MNFGAGPTWGTYFKVEPDGKLKVELDCGTLMASFESISDVNVDLWAIECTITRVQLPPLSYLIKHRFQCLLCLEKKNIESESLHLTTAL